MPDKMVPVLYKNIPEIISLPGGIPCECEGTQRQATHRKNLEWTTRAWSPARACRSISLSTCVDGSWWVWMIHNHSSNICSGVSDATPPISPISIRSNKHLSMVRLHSMVHVSVCFHKNHVGSQHPQLYQQSLWKSTELNFWSSKPLVATSMDTDFGGKGRNWRTRRHASKIKQGHGRSEAWKSANEIGNNKDKAKKKTLGQKIKEYQSFVHSTGIPCRS